MSLKLKKESLSDMVSNSIKEMILNSTWKTGDRLPPESNLAEMFGVNRLTVRLGLQRLNDLGLVETRKGEGTFVRKFSLESYLNSVEDLYLDTRMLNDVCAFRSCIELESARLAIMNQTPAALDIFKKKYDEYINIPYHYDIHTPVGLNKYIDADLDFHYQICEMSGNRLFLLSFKMSKNIIRSYISQLVQNRMHLIVDEKGYPIENADNHKQIFESIQRRDVEGCMKVYSDMINYKIENPWQEEGGSGLFV